MMRAATACSVGIVVLCLGCMPMHGAPQSNARTTLAPGDERLRPPGLDDGTIDITVFTRPAGDAAERRAATVAVSERASAATGNVSLLTRVWSPPFTTIDSLTVDRHSLRPRDELLLIGKVARRYRYDGSRVTGTLTQPDSGAKAYDHDFPEPVFAFNEVEVLVRSIPYRVGLQVVVPLFSEVDQALERDTITVVEQTSDAAAGHWVVRFADPVITTRYVVDASSRRILDARTTQRASRSESHYVYPR